MLRTFSNISEREFLRSDCKMQHFQYAVIMYILSNNPFDLLSSLWSSLDCIYVCICITYFNCMVLILIKIYMLSVFVCLFVCRLCVCCFL